MLSRHFRLARASAVPTRPPLAGRSVPAARCTLAVTSLLALGVGLAGPTESVLAAQSGSADRAPLRLIQLGQTIGQPDAAAREPVLGDRTRRIIQGALKHLGHYQAPIDGVFGRTTRAAIWRYQVGNGFNGTGYLTSDQILKLFLEAKGEGERLASQAIAQQAAEAEATEATADEEASEDGTAAADDFAPDGANPDRTTPEPGNAGDAAVTVADAAAGGMAGDTVAGGATAAGTVGDGSPGRTQARAAPEPADASDMQGSSGRAVAAGADRAAGPGRTTEPPAAASQSDAGSDASVEAAAAGEGRTEGPSGQGAADQNDTLTAAERRTSPSDRSVAQGNADGATAVPTRRQSSPLEARAAEPRPTPEPALAAAPRVDDQARQMAALPVPAAPPASAEAAMAPDQRATVGPEPVRLPSASQEQTGRTSDAAVTSPAVPSLPLSALRRSGSVPEPVNARVRPSPPPAGGTVAPSTTSRPTAATARSGVQAVTPTDRAPVPVEQTVSASRSLATARAGSDTPDGVGADSKSSTTVIASTRLGDLSFSAPRPVQSAPDSQVAVATVTPQAAADAPVFPTGPATDDASAGVVPTPGAETPDDRPTVEPVPGLGPTDGLGANSSTGNGPTGDGPTGDGPATEQVTTTVPSSGAPADSLVSGNVPEQTAATVPSAGDGAWSASGGSDRPGNLPGAPEAMHREVPVDEPISSAAEALPVAENEAPTPSSAVATGPMDLPPGIQASDIPQRTIQQAYVTPGPSEGGPSVTSDAAAPAIGGLVPGVAGRQDSDAPSAMPKIDQQVMQNRVLSAAPSGDEIEAAPTRDNWLERLSGTFTGYIQTPESPGEFPVSTRFDYVDGVLTGDFQSFINGRRQRGRLTEVKVLDRRTIEMTWRHLWEAGPVRFHFSEDLSSFNGQWGRDQVEGVAWVGARR